VPAMRFPIPRLVLAALIASACGSPGGGPPAVTEGTCEHVAGTDAPEFLSRIGCTADFEALASEPLDATLPGARSAKVVMDLHDGGKVYFQNSVTYPIHYAFASTHLSGNGLPVVGTLAEFNAVQYYQPERRFLLGAVTHYDGPGRWALEIAPYDTADADMATSLFEAVKSQVFFGDALAFHPTSEAVTKMAAGLPGSVPLVTTDELYAAIDYQPLNLGTAAGYLRFSTAAALDDTYLSYEDIVVLDQAPNDISVVQGLITQEFQTPLSHLNVLSRNRRTPNMGLRGAMTNPDLKALEGKLVLLTVGALEWSLREATQAEAEASWAAHKPAAVVLPPNNLDVTDLLDIAEVTPEPTGDETLRGNLKEACRAFGGKAAQYSVLARTDGVPTLKAFAIPVYYYDVFMRENGLYDRLEVLLADDRFNTDFQYRDAKLADFRAAMLLAPVDAGLQDLLKAKLAAEFPGRTMRFRTSTNSEDLEGFPCAGCYESHTGDPADWETVLNAIRKAYSSAWLFRTFEERRYYGVAHRSVGMALLVHRNFPDEEANGVSVTANPFDASGLDPAYYVNVQHGGDAEVVHPPPGVTSDEFLYYFSEPNQPISFMTHSNLVPDGNNVLTARQTYDLGLALTAIHDRFSEAYGPASESWGATVCNKADGDTANDSCWYAMDVEFKFDDDDSADGTPELFIKQARPYPQPGS
jgi:hypothetical protein